MRKIFTSIVTGLFLLCFLVNTRAQTAEPFVCEPGLFQVISGQLYLLNPSNGEYVAIGPNAGFAYNNMAYNPADGFLYAISRGSGTDANGVAIDNRDLIRIDKDGEVFFVMDTGESGGAYAGDIVNGELWVRRSTTRYESIDLNTLAITQHNLTGEPARPADWVLIGNILYGVHGAKLYRIDTNNDQVTAHTISGIGNLTSQFFGATYAINNYQLYASNNAGGLWIIGDYTGSSPYASYEVATIPTNSNDGSSCPTAPFPVANIGLAKSATHPIDNGNGTYTVTYTLVIQNYGNMSFFDLTLLDNLTPAFGSYTSGTPSSPGTYTVANATISNNTTVPFTINTTFTGDPNGSGNANHNLILTANGGELDGFPSPESMTVTFDVTFYPAEGRTLFFNQAAVYADITGDGATDSNVIDFSTDGNNPDSDSDNNPVDDNESTQININEICNNGIDDDEDGDIDCDDGDCAGVTGCVVAGAGGGGLESETTADLAAKIAARDYHRTVNNIDLEKKENLLRVHKPENYGAFTEGVNFRDDFNIEDFMPIDLFPNSETFISTPEDLVDITNATQVASIDLFEEEQRLAAVLGVKSDGVYQHSKYICDRVKGAIIRDIFSRKIDGERDFIVTYFTNKEGNIEYNTNISLYINDEGDFTMESHWNLDDYPQDETFYNFQIWANGISRLEAMTNEIIHLLEAKLPISDYKFTGPPAVYAKNLYYDNGKVVLNIINNIGAEEITVRGATLENETSTNQDFEYKLPLNGEAEEQIAIETDGIYSFGADIIHDREQTADVIFTVDGFWGLAYAPQTTTIDNWNISKSDHQDFDDASWIERNFEVQAETENQLTVYRSLNPAFRSEDFSDYNTFSFEIEGSGEIEIVILKSNIERIEDQMTYTYQLDGSCRRVYIHKSEFENTQEWDDVKMIYFTQRKTNDDPTQAIDLKISNVAFVNNYEPKDCDVYNSLTLQVYPNPSDDGTINFKLPMAEVDYNLTITNQLGQVVFTQRGSLLVDGILTLEDRFEPGVYFYRMELDSGTVGGKFLMRK